MFRVCLSFTCCTFHAGGVPHVVAMLVPLHMISPPFRARLRICMSCNAHQPVIHFGDAVEGILPQAAGTRISSHTNRPSSSQVMLFASTGKLKPSRFAMDGMSATVKYFPVRGSLQFLASANKMHFVTIPASGPRGWCMMPWLTCSRVAGNPFI